MASWKKILTTSDNASYQNEAITLAQLNTGVDAETSYGASKVLKVNSSGNGLEFATDTNTNTFRTIVAGSNTLEATETLTLTAGSNITITEESGEVSFAASVAAASSNSYGTIKVGFSEDASAKEYPVELDVSGNAFVQVPWTDNNTTYSVGDGGLTEKNFTSTLKTKLDGIATSANNYSLPTASSSTLGGVKIGSGISISSGVISADTQAGTYSFSVTADSGTDQAIASGNTLDIAGGTGVTTAVGATDTVTVSIGQAVGTTDNVTFNNVSIDGNLTVSGSQTTTISETVEIEDNRLLLNSNASGYTSLAGNNGSTSSAGIEVERGSAGNAYLTFRETGSAASGSHKGQWYMYRPYEGTSGTANNNDIERLAAVQSLQYKSGAPVSGDEGHIYGGLLYDDSNGNLYVCTNPYVDNSGGGGA